MQDIILIHGYEDENGKVHTPVDWPNMKYDGHPLTNENLRSLLPQELIIEFDFSDEVPLDEGRAEALCWVEKVKEELVRSNASFIITDHKGKSPHVRITIEGLQYFPDEYCIEYRTLFVDELLKKIGFNSKRLSPDVRLYRHKEFSRLVPLQGAPHWKRKWKGAVEETIFSHDGHLIEVQRDRMREVIDTVKKERFAVSNEPIDVKNVNVDALKRFWQNYWSDGQCNKLLLGFGGQCRRRHLTYEQSCGLLKMLLEHVGHPDYYNKMSRELEYSFKHDIDDVAVYAHLKDLQEATQ